METPTGKYAIVRGVPATYDGCITPKRELWIDVALAREQHLAYCETLEGLGLEIVRLEPDERFPDCCFVEDAAVVAGDKAVVLHMGAPSRVGEEIEVGRRLRDFKEVYEIEPPARIDGGDVLKIDRILYVGVSQRTDLQGISQLDALVSGEEFLVSPVQVRDVLHLKSACSYLGDDHVLIFPGHVGEEVFAGYRTVLVHDDEAYSANCLAINGKVLMSKGFPRTRDRVRSAGFETIELDMSEFQKCGGSLTCLSIIF